MNYIMRNVPMDVWEPFRAKAKRIGCSLREALFAAMRDWSQR